MRWIEISPGYACNCRCSGCYSCSTSDDVQMAWSEVEHWLRYGRVHGARHLWLSGGEPTLRKDFLRTLKRAQQLGYERIKVQSNGMLFSYRTFTERAVAAGMTEVNLLLKSLDARRHDGLNRTPGSHKALHQGIERLRAFPQLRLEGDFLMTSRNYQELPELVRYYLDRDLVHFNIWLFALVDQGDKDLRRFVPRLADAMPYVLQAADIAEAAGATLCSLNTPHCLVPPDRWDLQFDARGMELFVVNPGGNTFMLETSSIEHGEYVDRCGRCAARPHCRGMRPDYLELHGDDELRALSAEEIAGHDPRGSVLDAAPVTVRSVAARARDASTAP